MESKPDVESKPVNPNVESKPDVESKPVKPNVESKPAKPDVESKELAGEEKGMGEPGSISDPEIVAPKHAPSKPPQGKTTAPKAKQASWQLIFIPFVSACVCGVAIVSIFGPGASGLNVT